MIDYVKVKKSALGMLMDVHVPRGAGGVLYGHYLVVAKIKGGRF